MLVYGLSPTYLKDSICIKETSYTFGNANLLDIPERRTQDLVVAIFSFRTAKPWNMLLDEAKKIAGFNLFKAIIKGWSGTECYCALCR